MSLLQRIGVWMDVRGGRARMAAFRSGWAADSVEGVKFHRTAKTQFRYRERPGPSAGAPTIVFAADPPATIEFYDELLDVFSQRFRTLVVELPAMGFSATTSQFGFGFRETNDEVEQFLDAVAGRDAILAFSCVATLAAIDIAARRPDLVSRLILIQGGSVEAFDRWKAARDPKGILAKPVFGQMVMKRVAPKRVGDWYRLSAGRREMVQGFCDCASDTMGKGALWTLASAYQVYMDPDVELSAPTQPALLIWGGADRSHPDGNLQRIQAFLPGVETRYFEDLGHAPEVEDPVPVFHAITAFLKETGQDRAGSAV